MKRIPQRQEWKLAAPPARGFTLVELIVVVGIIAFLITMTVTVVTSSITTAREKQTKATIKKIDSLLTARMDAFTIGLKAQKHSVLQQKVLFKQGFPQTPAEAGLSGNTVSEADSSEAMYHFLFHSESFGGPPEGEDAFKDVIQDTDGDDLKEFVDGWGQPLRFYRWPTRLIRPGNPATTPQSYTGTYPNGSYAIAIDKTYAGVFFASLPSELHKDPQDPLGQLNPLSITNMAQFESNYHTPETWSLPLIVSAGQDGVLGLYEPGDKTNFGHLAQPKLSDIGGIDDNFSNRRLQP